MVDFKFKNRKEREKRKEKMLLELDEMFWLDPDLYHALCSFVHNTKNKLLPEQKTTLVARGFLLENGAIPDITNEAVWEAITGKKPYWL